MKPPEPEWFARLLNEVHAGKDLPNSEARVLAEMALEGFGPNHTWWTAASAIPAGSMVLLWNGKAITPPMRFDDETEARFFKSMHETLYFLRIPTPPRHGELMAALTKKGKANAK